MNHTKLRRAFSIVLMLALIVGCFVNTGAVSAKAASAAITIDGKTDDWKDIKSSLDEPTGRYDRVAAFCDNDNFYCLFTANDLSDWCYYEVFIDTDCNLDTGFDGFEYMQENGNLYISYGGEWPDTEIEDACESAMSEDGQTVEMRIPLSIIKPTGKDVTYKVVLLNDNWEWVHIFSGKGDSEKAEYVKKALIDSKQNYISDIKLNHKSLKSLTKATIQGGTIGTFSAKGGDEKKYSYTLIASEKNGPDNGHFEIKNNKLVTVDKLLAPGTYKIYVKVKSGVRSELKQIKIKVGKPDASSITEDFFVGEQGDWFTVAHNTASEKADAEGSKYSLNATRSQDKLYMMLESDLKNLNTETIFAISTGNKGIDFLGLGKFNYVVRDGKLFKLTAADAVPELVKTVDTTFDKAFTSARVLLSDLGSPKNIKVRAFALNKTVSVPKKDSMKVSKSFKMFLDDAYFYPEENFDITANPYKGFAGTEASETPAYPFTILVGEGAKATDLNGNALPKGCKGAYPEGTEDTIEFINHMTIMDTIEYVKSNKLSWIGPCSPANYNDGDMKAYFFEGNVEYLQRILGYNLSVKRISKVSTAKAGKTLKLTAEFRNKGVTNFKGDASFAVVLLDKNGKVVAHSYEGKVSKAGAGKTTSVDFSLKLGKSLKKGSYTLAAAVVDAKTGAPVVTLANANTNDVQYTELYTIKIK